MPAIDMTKVINCVMNNYLWFIIGVIVILLTIIGRYADKTNFGEGKKIVKVKKKKNDLVDELEVENKESEEVKNDIDEMLNQNKEEKEEIKEDTSTSNEESNNTIELEENAKDSRELTTEEFLKTDDLDVLLPKKDVLNDDLLQDIDDIRLDFNNKKKTSLIPDLDDLDLPSIKKKNTTTDIWK